MNSERVIDIHKYEKNLHIQKELLERSPMNEENKDVIREFIA